MPELKRIIFKGKLKVNIGQYLTMVDQETDDKINVVVNSISFNKDGVQETIMNVIPEIIWQN
jgi:hypothetical protein